MYESLGRGAVVSFTLDTGVWTTVEHDPGLTRYEVDTPYDVTVGSRDHLDPRLRGCLRVTSTTSHIRLRSWLDGPRVSGLGGSSSFCVGTVLALRGVPTPPADLADLAATAEIELAGQRIGLQDHYAAAFGGVNHIDFSADGVSVTPLEIPIATRDFLATHLWVAHIGGRHDSSAILGTAFSGPLRDRSLGGLVRLADIAKQMLVDGRCDNIGEMLDEGWNLKRQSAPGASSPVLDELYRACLNAGAAGGKVLGAGGSGYLLLVIPPDRIRRFRSTLSRVRVRRLPWSGDGRGARIVGR